MLLTHKAIGYCGTTAIYIGDAALIAAALVQDERLTSSGILEDAPVLSAAMHHIHAAALIGAYMSCAWPGGGFGARAFLRYPQIDHELKVSTTVKWLVALELLVNEVRSRHCAVASDKIIAPLTFAMHSKFAPDAISELFGESIKSILNLRQSTERTYCRFTTFIIESMNCLDILSRIDRDGDLNVDKDENLALPSWVPNFSLAGTTSLIDNLLLRKYDASRLTAYCQIPNGNMKAL